MDLTPQTLREVEFREKLRGYHPDDVDDFLEEVAVAVGAMLARLQAAESGLPAAAATTWTDVRPAAAPTPDVAGEAPTSETLRRTLLLAQRTADLAIAEAESSARQIVEHAEAEADRIKSEAQAAVAALMDEATARTESTVGDLEAKRAGLEREVAALHAWASQHRDRIREALNDQIRSLDVWLSTNPPPRPTRATPALRGASSGALSARRALGSTPRPRPTRLPTDAAGVPPTDADQAGETGILRRRVDSPRRDAQPDAPSADDVFGGPAVETTTPQGTEPGAGEISPASPEIALDNPDSGGNSVVGGLGSRLYRRR